MNGQNPFEVPQSCSGAPLEAVVLPTSNQFHVDGDLLVCGEKVTLPPFCIYTAETQDLVPLAKKTEIPSMTLVIKERSAEVTLFISRSELSRRNRVRGKCLASGIASGVLSVFSLLSLNEKYWNLAPPIQITMVLMGIGVLISSLLVFNRQSPMLKLVRYTHPGVYWIRGLPLPFLQRLATLSVEEMRTHR